MQHLIATHSGSFHADDVFAVCVLLAILGVDSANGTSSQQVIRTRNQDLIDSCQFAVDVGGAYDPARGRFDHHQKGFSVRRANSIPYAAAGLVWKHYGAEFVQVIRLGLSDITAETVASVVDARLVQYLDAIDTGHMSPGVLPASLPMLVSAFNPTWDEGATPECYDARFIQAVSVVRSILTALVNDVTAEVLAADIVRSCEVESDGQIIVLSKSGLPWTGPVCDEMPKVLFVVYPDSDGNQYQIRVVPVAPDSYQARKDMPEAWAGLRDADLAEVTGVSDSVFCHNGRFIAGARSKEGALRLARLALQS